MEACAQMGFARKLAAPNKKTREKAISLLALWLGSQKQISEEELKKLWKGLFYCVWHSDKVPVQADLIERLASLLEKLDIPITLQFFEVFLTTMRREWAGIDRLRMDKFYLLLRKFLAHMFAALKNTGWDQERTKDFMNALLGRAFLAKDQYAALGINLHYADIFLHELERFLPLSPKTARLLLEPFLVVYASSSDKSLLDRIRKCVFERLFVLGGNVIAAKQEGGTALEGKEEALGLLVLGLPLAAEAFKLASVPSTQQLNRKKLYELHGKFEMLEKLMSTSGVSIPLVDADGVMPNLSRGESTTKLKKRKVAQKLVSKDPGKKAQNQFCGGMVDNKEDVGSDISMNLKGKKRKQKHTQSNKKQHTEGAEDDHLTEDQNEGAPNTTTLKRKRKSTEIGMDMKHNSQEVGDMDTGGEEHVVTGEEGSQQCPSTSDPSDFTTDDSVISNLRFQFDLLAAEGLMETDLGGTPMPSSPSNIGNKKRKRLANRSGSASRVAIRTPSPSDHRRGDGSPGGKVGNSSGKAKRVRFALKKNLVWKPFSPLPPQSLRVPPSAMPRGSALKKGVPPGPIVASVDDVLLKKRKKGTPRRPSIQSNVKSIRNLARASASLKKLYGSA